MIISYWIGFCLCTILVGFIFRDLFSRNIRDLFVALTITFCLSTIWPLTLLYLLISFLGDKDEVQG